MVPYVKTAVIIEKEIEKLNCLEKFNHFTDVCSFYHFNLCEKEKCINYSFINKLKYIC